MGSQLQYTEPLIFFCDMWDLVSGPGIDPGPPALSHWTTRAIKKGEHRRTDVLHFVVIVQLLSCVQLFEMQWTIAHQVSLSFTIFWSSLKFMSTELVILSNHLILCRPLLLLPSVFPSIKVFSNELVLCIRWPKYWSFSISPSNEYSGLISFRIDWFDLLAVQGSQESSPTPKFKSINSSALSFLCSQTLTSIHDYWKNHSFD